MGNGMIIEFLGLPGAGKSSLEQALIREFEERNRQVLTRAQAVDMLASSYSPFPRNRSPFLRKISTLAYKLVLLKNVINKLGRQFSLWDLLHIHRIRAAMRVIEDLFLYRMPPSLMKQEEILIISEGIGQHLVGLHAWRQLLGKSSQENFECFLETANLSHRALIIYIDIPEKLAEVRLNARGVPDLWPTSVPPRNIISAFSGATPKFLSKIRDIDGTRVIKFEGELAAPSWQKQAKEIVLTLDTFK